MIGQRRGADGQSVRNLSNVAAVDKLLPAVADRILWSPPGRRSGVIAFPAGAAPALARLLLTLKGRTRGCAPQRPSPVAAFSPAILPSAGMDRVLPNAKEAFTCVIRTS